MTLNHFEKDGTNHTGQWPEGHCPPTPRDDGTGGRLAIDNEAIQQAPELPPDEFEIRVAEATGIIPRCPFCGRWPLITTSYNAATSVYGAKILCDAVYCGVRLIATGRTREEARQRAIEKWSRRFLEHRQTRVKGVANVQTEFDITPRLSEPMKLDSKDIGVLVELYCQGCRSIELEGNTEENRRRLYRMSRAGLCGCTPQQGWGGHTDPIWGISDKGEDAIALAERDGAGAWRDDDFEIEI